MMKDSVKLLPVSELQDIGKKLLGELLKSSSKPSTHLNYQVQLLEVLNYQIKRYSNLHYCDFELAIVCYDVTEMLLEECRKHESSEIQDFVKIIELTLIKKKEKVDSFKAYINDNKTADETPLPDQDPLVSRFNKLSTNIQQEAAPSDPKSLDTYKLREVITAPELHTLLTEELVSVLLIDFRTKKEYDYNHINYSNVINIPPTLLSSLENNKKFDDITDQDLEEKLRLLLSDTQYQLFQKRHKYDIIVIYNLKYGAAEKSLNRFDALANSLIKSHSSGDPSKNPFSKLSEILACKNKYLSSRLKRAPCYLAGGVSYWYSLYGELSITKSKDPVLTQPPASLSRNGSASRTTNNGSSSVDTVTSVSNGTPYLRSFGDYLGTAKSSNTPVSNRFVKKEHAPKIGVYSPSAPLKPKISNFSSSSETRPSYQPPPEQQKPQRKQSFSISSKSSASSSPAPTSSGDNSNNFLEQYTTGLTNLGNSCYMNCIIQCLGATPQLTKFFFPSLPKDSPSGNVQSYKQHINVNNHLGTKGILTTSFVTLIVNMLDNAGGNFSPLHFKKVIGSLSPGGQFANFDQQDCIEFLTFLLDSLHEDLNQMMVSSAKEKQAIMELTPEQEKTREYLPVRLASTIEWERYLKLNFSIVVDYFQGQYLSQLRCLECGTTSTTYNAFLILSLPIPEKINKLKEITLEDCLQEFVQLELLDDENKWHCSLCKRFTRSTKKITITRLPQVLIIHFKRFKLSPAGYFSKIDDFIKYPVNEVLDLTRYWPEVGTVVNPNLKSSEVMSKETEAEVLSTLPTRNQIPPFRYKLYGVANHFGNLTTGHYTAYVHKENDKKKSKGWCYFDDSRVTYNQKESLVLNKNAYCLFYQRV